MTKLRKNQLLAAAILLVPGVIVTTLMMSGEDRSVFGMVPRDGVSEPKLQQDEEKAISPDESALKKQQPNVGEEAVSATRVGGV